MGTAKAALGLSVAMLSLSIVALIPCLGALNWLNLFVLAEVQHVAWWISFLRERGPGARGKRLISIPFVIVAVFISIVRLFMGGGCL